MRILTFLLATLFIWSTEAIPKRKLKKYSPSWDSLDTRPLPKWFDEYKVGIFIHWGVFSVPSFHSEWFWNYWKSNDSEIVQFMEQNYPPDFTYQEFARDFTAEFFNPAQWADLFAKSGAKYVVLTSKHHEGFTMWPSKYSYSWNSKDIGPHRDIVGELSHHVRNKGLDFGVYHSLYEWFNPMYLNDKKNNFKTKNFVYNKALPEMIELIEGYQPSILWSDGDWEATDTYWNSTEFLAWLYNESPVKDRVVVNDRWGIGIPCKHGDFYNCADRYNPGVLQSHKWENAMTIDKQSWGYRRNAKLSEYMTIHEIITTMAVTVSCGGNILINIGPTKDGIITPIFEERLTQLGEWLSINGEAIYKSKPWQYQNDTTTSGVWYTTKENSVYAIVLYWPEENELSLGAPVAGKNPIIGKISNISLLGVDEQLKFQTDDDNLVVAFPAREKVLNDVAWVLKMDLSASINVKRL